MAHNQRNEADQSRLSSNAPNRPTQAEMRPRTPQEGEKPQRSSSRNFRASTSVLPTQQSSLGGSRVSSLRASLGIAPIPEERPTSRQSNVDSLRRSSRESSKENLAPPDADEYERYRKDHENLKAEMGTLQYKMETAEKEKEIALSQQALQAQQAAEEAQKELKEQIEALKEEITNDRNEAEEAKAAIERSARETEDNVRQLEEKIEEIETTRDDAARAAEKRTADALAQVATLNRSLLELQQEAEAREEAIQQTQAQIAERDEEIARQEGEILRLKAQGGDAETMLIIKKELTEQVTYIRKLEATNRDQLAELKHLRSGHKAVEIVEEEKRSLQRKLQAAETVEAELQEERIQRQRLEDERLAWTAYLQKASEGGSEEFDSPEAMARALVEERLNTASKLEQIGGLQAEVSAKDITIASFEAEKAQLQQQVAEAQTTANAASTDKARLRLERQRALAVKEVEYLRAQLKTFDVEDETMEPENHDQSRSQRIQELEDLVDKYKTEVQALHTELSTAEPKNPNASPQPLAGSKRSREEIDDAEEKLGQLTRKNRKLQEDLSQHQTQIQLLEKDLSATREQLTAAKEHSSVRVLSLRSNPTSDYEKIKRETLDALQKENKDLLALLNEKNADVPLIPNSVLATMQREIKDAKAQTLSAEKSARRLKEVWGSKSQEFKEAIFSTLGWTVTFIPNGKMRVESTFFPSQTEENENSIVFDGERGTMKVGGGPKSKFARRIQDQIGFWVREKGCIPGFLAALTLEFYEEHQKNQGAA